LLLWIAVRDPVTRDHHQFILIRIGSIEVSCRELHRVGLRDLDHNYPINIAILWNAEPVAKAAANLGLSLIAWSKS
jgi:hypothetical protein